MAIKDIGTPTPRIDRRKPCFLLLGARAFVLQDLRGKKRQSVKRCARVQAWIEQQFYLLRPSDSGSQRPFVRKAIAFIRLDRVLRRIRDPCNGPPFVCAIPTEPRAKLRHYPYPRLNVFMCISLPLNPNGRRAAPCQKQWLRRPHCLSFCE